MKHGKFWPVAGCIVLLSAALPAAGADLLSVYDQALVNDPQIREAEATRRASREARPQSIAALLPQVSAGAGRSRSQTESALIANPQWTSGSNWNIGLRQNIFSWQNWVALKSASHQVAQAEANFLAQQQALVQRVAQQYFAVLQAQDTVRAQEAARDAYNRQFEQAEQRFDVGLYAITEVQEARAARDNAAANVIGARRSLASVQEQLRATIGQLPDSLNEPADTMPLLTPDPEDADAWVNLSMEQNASLIASRLGADIARDQVSSAFGGHLPSLDLSVNRSHSDASSSFASNSKSISLSLSIPIFSGGATQSRVRQSEYQWIAAKERLERTSRDTERQARDAYLSVISDIARVQALRQALESSRTALTATEAGMEVGTRTIVDVLNQRQQLIQAETSYSSAKYQYLNDLISLQLAAGTLDRTTLELINGWLTAAPAPAAP